MLEDLRNKMLEFYKDIDKNVKDEESALYVKKQTTDLVDFVIDEIEKIMDYKEEKLNALIKKQQETDQMIQELNNKMENVYEDIYDEMPEDEFLISCPYCGFEFDADIDEDFSEIRCPECGNTIELDWNGNPDDDDRGCGGSCSHCGGCK